MTFSGAARRLLERFSHHYILLVMFLTRLAGSTGGVLVVYYVNLTLDLPERIRVHFSALAVIVVVVAVLLTILHALWETRHLRRALAFLGKGTAPIPDVRLAEQAAREAVLFPGRHHRAEAWIVPVSTLLPVFLFLKLVDDASSIILINITIAVFMGIAMALMSTFFLIERFMEPVIGYLMERGVTVPYASLPVSRLRWRLNVCFTLILLTATLMIGTLARQRASDLIDNPNPERQAEAVANLRTHTVYITIAAVIIGVLFASVLAQSVASRVGRLLQAMHRVAAGSLAERVQATGNDEVDILTRQFNAMVQELDHNHRTIQDLNSNLERKVKQRTRQLSKSRRELERSLQELQEHDRLKTEFFSNVSHELRTPLAMILSPLEQVLRKQRGQLSAETSAMLEVANLNGRRLFELINRLLEFSKLGAGQAKLRLGALDLNGLVRKLTTAASPLALHRNVRLGMACDPDLPLFAADEEKVDTILSNLISNAIKFTPAGGTIDVETARTGDRVRVVVRDTGIGIDPANQGRIFERFMQIDGSASREFPGTGLGLALAKELVELHQGEIGVDSEPGRGSQFWFCLPLLAVPESGEWSVEREAPATLSAPRAALGAPPHKPSSDPDSFLGSRFTDLITYQSGSEQPEGDAHQAPARAPTILVVDDTPEVRLMLRSLLADDYHILLARDGAEGTERALRELPDLIVSDVMMPHVDGYEFCRRVKQEPTTVQIPFIMLTAKAERSMKIEGLECGADDYVVKPFDSDELRARVRSLLKLRRLNQTLDERNTELQTALQELQTTQARLVDMAHRAGMTEIATGVLHNVGNVLNSVNISLATIGGKLRKLKLDGLGKAAALLGGAQNAESRAQSAESASQSADGATRSGLNATRLPEYLSRLNTKVTAEKEDMLAELDFLSEKLEDIRRIISAQQNFARRVPFSEEVDLRALIDDILAMHSHSFAKHNIEVLRELEEVPAANLEKLRLVQVLDNFIRNAVQSMKARTEGPRCLTIRLQSCGQERMRLSVSDTGRGIAADDLKKIFSYGFTTKQGGNGFGLHSAANAMAAMGGVIKAHSDGVNQGATFTIEFPFRELKDQPLLADRLVLRSHGRRKQTATSEQWPVLGNQASLLTTDH